MTLTLEDTIERDALRAACDAGYMPISEYVRRYGEQSHHITNPRPAAHPACASDQPASVAVEQPQRFKSTDAGCLSISQPETKE